jgi:hypothetical protein
MQSFEIYQLHAWLRGISPLIWRRLLFRSDQTIADLHYALQLAFGWSDSHLHTFRIHRRDFGVYHSGGPVLDQDATQVRLADFHFRIGERFLYEYDFGEWLVFTEYPRIDIGERSAQDPLGPRIQTFETRLQRPT